MLIIKEKKKKKRANGCKFASFSTISHAFHSLFKVLFIFPSWYLFAIGVTNVFSQGWNIPPNLRLYSQRTWLTNKETQNTTQNKTTGITPCFFHQSWCVVRIYVVRALLQLQFNFQKKLISNRDCFHFTRRY